MPGYSTVKRKAVDMATKLGIVNELVQGVKS